MAHPGIGFLLLLLTCIHGQPARPGQSAARRMYVAPCAMWSLIANKMHILATYNTHLLLVSAAGYWLHALRTAACSMQHMLMQIPCFLFLYFARCA